MEKLNLTITGMSCGHCVGAVTEALKELAGVEVERVRVGSASVAYDPAAVSPQQITQAVEEAGYGAQPAAA